MVNIDADELEWRIRSAAAAATETANEGKARGAALPDDAPATNRLIEALYLAVTSDDLKLCRHARDAVLDAGDALIWVPPMPTLLCRTCFHHALAAIRTPRACSVCSRPDVRGVLVAAGPILIAGWACAECRGEIDFDRAGRATIVEMMVGVLLDPEPSS